MILIELQHKIADGRIDIDDVDMIKRLYMETRNCSCCWDWNKSDILDGNIIPYDRLCPHCEDRQTLPPMAVTLEEIRNLIKELRP